MSELKLEVGNTYIFKDDESKQSYLSAYSCNPAMYRTYYKEGFLIGCLSISGAGYIKQSDDSSAINSKELKYFKLKEDTTMVNNTFTKDMLVAGKHICETRNGYKYMVMISDDGLFMSDPSKVCEYMTLSSYSYDLKYDTFNCDPRWDIVKIYTASRPNRFYNWNELNLVWERKPIHTSKIAELENTINSASKSIEDAKVQLKLLKG